MNSYFGSKHIARNAGRSSTSVAEPSVERIADVEYCDQFHIFHRLSHIPWRLLLLLGSYKVLVDHALTLAARKRAKTGYGFLTGMDCGVGTTSKYFLVLPTLPLPISAGAWNCSLHSEGVLCIQF